MIGKLLCTLALVAIVPAGMLIAQPCMGTYTFTASTPPVNGTYDCGQTVTFCYTVTHWNTTSVNWFHGIGISMGPGWDMATLVPGPPPATCDGSGGTWGWYTSVTGTASTNIGPQGPGFFFDRNNDGNPGNNFGDNCSGNVNWQFCWTISVLSGAGCATGLDLSVSVNSFGDSETGSWSSAGCGGDAIANSAPAVIGGCSVDAGLPAALSLCTTSAPLSLFAELGGLPDTGGTWTDPAGAAHSGTLDPATDISGTYTYSVGDNATSCTAQSTVTVTIATMPQAGSDASYSACGNASPFAMISRLGGSPDTGGSWTDAAGASVPGTFDPATNTSGTFHYTVPGTAPCSSAQAELTITVVPPPQAGVNGAVTVCSDGDPFSLINELGGAPDENGVWTGPGGTPVTDVYTPGTSVSGVHTYTVPGTAPCTNAAATVTVTEVMLPDAGTSATVSLCETAAPVPLIGLLGGSPDANGTWTDPQGAPQGAIVDPSVAVSGTYTYLIAAVGSCPSQQATVELTINSQPSAGTSTAVPLCTDGSAVDLFTLLGGTPATGGEWTMPDGSTAPSTFDPATGASGTFTYTVTATAPCSTQSATVTVNVSAQPDAGASTTLSVCSDASAVSLFPLLGPNAQTGGTWTGPAGASTGVFTPGSAADGAYTYGIGATAPCVASSATITVSTTLVSNAGTDASLALCSTDAAVALINSLGGSPMTGGVWTGPNGSASNGTLAPATAASGAYVYTLPVNGPCPAATATVTATIAAAADAGQNGGLSYCSTDVQPIQLITGLAGSPPTGGAWTGPDSEPHGPSVVPGSDPVGVYTYTVPAPSPCPAATSEVIVTMVQAANAGSGGSVSICENAAPVVPGTWLGGTPDAGGTWTGPNGIPITQVDPATASAGNYTYMVPGSVPCPNVQATVQVSFDALPHAGTDASVTLCADAAPIAMLSLLGNPVSAGGSWSGPSSLSGGTFIPGAQLPGTYTYAVQGTGACALEQAQASVTVSVVPLPDPAISVSVARGCVPLMVQFGVNTGTPLQSANWSFGDGYQTSSTGNSTHTYGQEGLYSVQVAVSDIHGCAGSALLTGAVLASAGPTAIFSVTPEKVSVADPLVQLVHDPEMNVDYAWSVDGTPASLIDGVGWTFPAEAGPHEVCLQATDSLGCSNSLCHKLIVDDVLTLFAPNAFTPDGDGLNDVFLPSVIGAEATDYSFLVFNRWGQLVFSTTDPHEGWNGGMNNSGEVQPQDVYVWRVLVRDQFTTERKEHFGTATLLR